MWAKRAYGEEGAMLRFVQGALEELLTELKSPVGVPKIEITDVDGVEFREAQARKGGAMASTKSDCI